MKSGSGFGEGGKDNRAEDSGPSTLNPWVNQDRCFAGGVKRLLDSGKTSQSKD